MNIAELLNIVGCVLVFIAAAYNWPNPAQPQWRPGLFPLGVAFWMLGHLLAGGIVR